MEGKGQDRNGDSSKKGENKIYRLNKRVTKGKQ